MRVVSVLPSATEMLYALGIEPVGVSHECDYPPQARERPSVIETRIDTDTTSEQIHDQVATANEDSGVYEIDRELLGDLDPDVIVSQGVCEVCAVDDSEIRAAVESLALDVEIITTDPHSLEDVFADLERLGKRLDCARRARRQVDSLRARAEELTAATPDAEDGPRVVVCDWLDPVMIAGHWVPEMIERVGGQYGLADPGERSRPREWETIREYDPERLVAAPCGFGREKTREQMSELTDRDGWEELTAVQRDAVSIIDGNHYVNRPGPRLLDTLERFAEIVHPDPPEQTATRASGGDTR